MTERSPINQLSLQAEIHLTSVDPATQEKRIDGRIGLGTVGNPGDWNLSPKGYAEIARTIIAVLQPMIDANEQDFDFGDQPQLPAPDRTPGEEYPLFDYRNEVWKGTREHERAWASKRDGEF